MTAPPRCSAFVALLICFLSVVACGGAATPKASPLTLAQATRPFVARGFVVGCPNLATKLPGGATHALNIALPGAVANGRLCSGKPGTLTLYGTTAEAKRSCKLKEFFCGGPQYEIRNVVVAIDPSGSAAVRGRMLAAIRTLGQPTRIA